jgi:hypothetical protein
MDCVSARSMRTATGITTRSARSLSMDVAIVIGKPMGQEDDEGELQACLDLWRMDCIDVSNCTQFLTAWRTSRQEQVKTQMYCVQPNLSNDRLGIAGACCSIVLIIDRYRSIDV